MRGAFIMPKRKYTNEERERLGIHSSKRKRSSSRVVYDDEIRPRKTANFDYEEEDCEEAADDSAGWILAGFTILVSMAIFMQ
jgi:hypothetical protein